MDGEAGAVGVVEDDPHFRAYVERAVDAAPGLECAFASGSLAEARARFDETGPDLCLIDLELPDGSGIELVRHIRSRTDCRVLVLTVLGDQGTVMEALKAGAHGYILKDSSGDQIIDCIRQTLAGFAPISPQVAVYLTRLLSEHSGEPGPAGEDRVRLTEREAETLSIFARGLSYREAGEVLGVSPHTISDFVKKIYRKLNVHSRGEAVFEAQSLGLIDRKP